MPATLGCPHSRTTLLAQWLRYLLTTVPLAVQTPTQPSSENSVRSSSMASGSVEYYDPYMAWCLTDFDVHCEVNTKLEGPEMPFREGSARFLPSVSL
jgi:hypothetical protein